MIRSANARLSVVIAIAIAAVLLVVAAGNGNDPEAPQVGSPPQSQLLVRPDSHSLNNPADARATFVEFLDFECEACRAAFPIVEQLRAEFGEQVRFVIRYFPIPSHRNAMNAALAVEAAARQGKLVEMYTRMYETQGEWGEKDNSEAARFRGFAQDFGLDLVRYDQDVADPAVRDRVQRDAADGAALGVQGTPTFFLNGSKLQPQSFDELRTSLETAIAE